MKTVTVVKRKHGFGWKNQYDPIHSCILAIYYDGAGVTHARSVLQRLNHIIKARDLELDMYGNAIYQFDSDKGTNIDLEIITKLAKILNLRIRKTNEADGS